MFNETRDCRTESRCCGSIFITSSLLICRGLSILEIETVAVACDVAEPMRVVAVGLAEVIGEVVRDEESVGTAVGVSEPAGKLPVGVGRGVSEPASTALVEVGCADVVAVKGVAEISVSGVVGAEV